MQLCAKNVVCQLCLFKMHGILKAYFDPLYAAHDVVLPVAAPEDVKLTVPFNLRRCGIDICSIETREKKLTSKHFCSTVSSVWIYSGTAIRID